MAPIFEEISQATQFWIKKGSKSNRLKQVKRMYALAEFAYARGARHVGDIGPRTLRALAKAKGLGTSASNEYRLAAQALYDLCGLDESVFSLQKKVKI